MRVIEPFLGGGTILCHKRPARLNIGIDLDEEVIRQWQAPLAGNNDGRFGIAFADGGISKRHSEVVNGSVISYDI